MLLRGVHIVKGEGPHGSDPVFFAPEIVQSQTHRALVIAMPFHTNRPGCRRDANACRAAASLAQTERSAVPQGTGRRYSVHQRCAE